MDYPEIFATSIFIALIISALIYGIKNALDNPYTHMYSDDDVSFTSSQRRELAGQIRTANEFKRNLTRYRSLSRKGKMRRRTLGEIWTNKFPPFPPTPE